MLAKIYSLYGGKLEQNVRVFLQARTKVNRGIIETIENSPDHFFAYTMVLQSLQKELPTEINGVHHLKKAKTTNRQRWSNYRFNSLSKDKNKATIVGINSNELNVTSSDASSDPVKISRYSNTQNAVREADFFSTHAFHVYMEKASNV